MLDSHSSTVRRLLDRILIRLSRSLIVDGLWIGVFSDGDNPEILRKVSEALQVIKTYDPKRYARVLKETEKIWVHYLPGNAAEYAQELRRCLVDPRFVLSSSPELIASVIVHEATHGSLGRYNIGYSEEVRHRVEKVCMRQELAFARKLPNGEELQRKVERKLAFPPELWTSEAMYQRRRAGVIALFRSGLSKWFVEKLVSLREKIAGLHH